MEEKIEQSTSQSSIDLLNEYHLLDIFKWLKFDDLMNLAETCTTFKHAVHRIFAKSLKPLEVEVSGLSVRVISLQLEVDQEMRLSGKRNRQRGNRVWFHIGSYVSSLTVECCGDSFGCTCSRLMKQIDWKKLKNLTIYYLCKRCVNNLLVPKGLYSCRNVEQFSLNWWDYPSSNIFLETFHKLKYLEIRSCKFDISDLRMVFQNNSKIKTLIFRGNYFDCQLLELIPEVEKLALDVPRDSGIQSLMNLNALLTLNQLTKLGLNCRRENLNNFFVDLARKGVIEELELHFAKFDNNSMKILKTFDKLQLLLIHNYCGPDNEPVELNSDLSTVFPPKLKSLALYEIDITHSTFFSIIRHAKCLESIDISLSVGEFHLFRDVTKLFQQILEAIKDNNRKQRLDVVLPWFYPFDFGKDLSGKERKLIESDRLRILHEDEGEYNPLGIYIRFPQKTEYQDCPSN